jgi:hypothetical protein
MLGRSEEAPNEFASGTDRLITVLGHGLTANTFILSRTSGRPCRHGADMCFAEISAGLHSPEN